MVNLLSSVEKPSGLTVNDSKTVVLWNVSSDPPKGIPWQIVQKARVLGVTITVTGQAVWSGEWEKFKQRLLVMRSSRLGWGSLLERARKVNAYATSVLVHALRTDIDVTSIVCEYEELVRSVLRTRMKWARLTAAVEESGYGVLDLVKLDRALKLSWLSYVSENRSRGVFEQVLRAWNSRTKSCAGTVVGPLLSWNSLSGDTRVWRSLCNAWERVEKWVEWRGPLRLWTEHDRDGGALVAAWNVEDCSFDDGAVFHRACDVVGGGDELLVLRRDLRKFVLEGSTVSIQPGVESRKVWKECLSTGAVGYTPSQARWKAAGFDWRGGQWRKSRKKKIPERVKWWLLDALNKALRVCYHSKSAPCRLCGQPVDGRHFTGGCPFTEEMYGFLKRAGEVCQREEVWWLVWKAHCGRGIVNKATLVRGLKRLRGLMG